jgi:ABC-2 type transport system permease protein
MSEHWKAFKTAAWLGWQYGSNWTEPWLFAIYSVIKPVAGTLILFFMFIVAVSTGSPAGPEMLGYIYVGNAFYMFVFQAFFGLFEVIQGDREWFQTIRYIYISPVSYYVYVIGRGVSQMGVAAIGVTIVLLFGKYLLGIPIGLRVEQLPFFVSILLLGVLCTVAIGVALAGLTFLMARHGGRAGEGVAGIFYVFSGVIFPLTVLPDWGQVLGRYIPLTYWFEGLRRALLPRPLGGPFLLSIPDHLILLYLAISTVIFVFISLGVFRYAEYLARKKGKIDMTTAY